MNTAPDYRRDLVIKYAPQLTGFALTVQGWENLSSIDKEDLFIRAQRLDQTTQTVSRLTEQPSTSAAATIPESKKSNSGRTLGTSKSSSKSLEHRRDYQREYYQRHKERAKEYQRRYALRQREERAKPRNGRDPKFKAVREVIKRSYHTGDIMHAPTEKAIKMFEKIIKGERGFVM